jgi:hypothetical protein
MRPICKNRKSKRCKIEKKHAFDISLYRYKTINNIISIGLLIYHGNRQFFINKMISKRVIKLFSISDLKENFSNINLTNSSPLSHFLFLLTIG